ncbi:MAG: hypothetical protein ACRD44_12330 [Bryobacteraceae bacterium]
MRARVTRWMTGISLTFVVSAIAPRLFSDSLSVRLEGGDLRLSTPNLPFLSGRVLERLRNGAVVYIDFHATLWTSPRTAPRRRSVTRVGVSYDLWEEKFSVAQTQDPKPRASMLSQSAAQEWCVDRLRISTSGLAPRSDFWVRLEVRAADPREETLIDNGTGISLTHLIDLLSRPQRDSQGRWSVEAGPLRLENLKR